MVISRRQARRLTYVVMPVLFCVVGYLLLWVALRPVWSLASTYASFLISKDAPSFETQLSGAFDPDAADAAATDAQIDYLLGEDVDFPVSGEHYGQLMCEAIGLDAPVYWYDSDEILAVGVGQSLISFPPGFGRVIILSGHNTTFFRCLESVREGDVIRLQTNYGAYEYQVSHVEVYDEHDLEALLLDKTQQEREELVMYTCWPFEFISGRKTQRLTVFADRVSGPDVRWRSLDAS